MIISFLSIHCPDATLKRTPSQPLFHPPHTKRLSGLSDLLLITGELQFLRHETDEQCGASDAEDPEEHGDSSAARCRRGQTKAQTSE